MASIDLQDAFHLVSLHESHRKFVRFEWKDTLYEYTCLPFGLSCSPRIFTKLMKPVVEYLRSRNHVSVIYLDDMLLIGQSYNQCQNNVIETRSLLEKLGLLVNEKKSTLTPTNELKYLGFIFNTKDMTMELPDQKRIKIRKICFNVINSKSISILKAAELIGYLGSASPAVPYSPLYIRRLEYEKTIALHKYNNYSSEFTFSTNSIEDLQWWLKNVPLAKMKIRRDSFDSVIFCDASLTGWGGHCNGNETRGFWTVKEKVCHINTLELLAILYSLKAFVRIRNAKILIRSDSTTAISYVNKYGGCRSQSCHEVAMSIWKWCQEMNIFIFASYISTSENYLADFRSRETLDQSDFSLGDMYFEQLCKVFYVPLFDLFASRATKKCKEYYSWFPDPESSGVDAFTFLWANSFYAFPPFNLIGRALRKIIEDNVSGIVVVPFWKCQPWWPVFTKICNNKMTIYGPNKKLLLCPYTNSPHPLWRSIQVAVAVVSPSLFAD